MKTALVGALCIVLWTTSVSAQTMSEDKALMAKGRLKIWTGVGLVTGGAILIPMTSPNDSQARGLAGTAMIFGGGSLIWLGVQDQRKALHPNASFGVMLGPRKGIQFARRW